MPTIRIDDEVYEAIKKLAEPLVDTPNRVLRRLLTLDGGEQPSETGRREPARVLREPTAVARLPVPAVRPEVTEMLRQPHQRADRTEEQKQRMLDLVTEIERLWEEGPTEGPSDAAERLDDYIYGPAD